MSDDNERISDLVKACRYILSFTSGMNRQQFIYDIKTQASVLYQIIILGEAVNRLSETFKAEHPEIPFDKIRGMRNRVTHEYLDIDEIIVWEVVQQSIPELLVLLEPLVIQDHQ